MVFSIQGNPKILPFKVQTFLQLEIYDLLGNLVTSFVLYPELKQLRIDLSNFPSGIYPYRIILDNINYEYDKIVLQK